MLEHSFWWIGIDVYTPWWLRRCLKCQARKTSRNTVYWPIYSVPLPSDHGVAVSVEYFRPLLTTPPGNSYNPLFADRFSQRAGMFAATAAEFIAKGTADIFINRY